MAFKLAKKAPAKKLAAKKAAPAKKTAAKKAAPRRVEDDDEPTTAKKGAAKKVSASKRVGKAASGWGGADELGGGGDFVKNLDFKNDAHKTGDTLWFILRFMDPEPYASVKIHWLNERKGKRSFVCAGEDCPLCDVGADVKSEMRFNVAVFTDSEPVLRSWAAGWRIYKKIKALADAPLTKPLPKRTYLATRVGKTFNEIQYDLDRINNDEIEESYPDIYVPSDDEIAELTGYTMDDVEKEYSTIDELMEIAAEVVEGE